MTPAAKKMKAIMSHRTPHTTCAEEKQLSQPMMQREARLDGAPCEGQHPQMCANADASDEFTLRATVSSVAEIGETHE